MRLALQRPYRCEVWIRSHLSGKHAWIREFVGPSPMVSVLGTENEEKP